MPQGRRLAAAGLLVVAALLGGCGDADTEADPPLADARGSADPWLPDYVSAGLNRPRGLRICPGGPEDQISRETTWDWVRESRVRGESMLVCAGLSGVDRRSGLILIDATPVSAGPLHLHEESRGITLRDSGRIRLTEAPEGERLSVDAVDNALLVFKTADGRIGRLRMAPRLKDVEITYLRRSAIDR